MYGALSTKRKGALTSHLDLILTVIPAKSFLDMCCPIQPNQVSPDWLFLDLPWILEGSGDLKIT